YSSARVSIDDRTLATVIFRLGMGGTTKRAILLSCGSFNPPTLAHLRMMELARDHLRSLPCPYTVVEGLFSPVSSTYVHKPLAEDEHRLAMLERATASSGWMRVDEWETRRGEWTRTKEVLRHHRAAARQRWSDDHLDCFLVCGGDLVDSFARLLPDGSRLWAAEDVKAIVEEYGIVVITRDGSSPAATLASFSLSLERAFTVSDRACPNDVSSTRLREALAEGRSIRYCTQDGVVDYILQHGLYGSSKAKAAAAAVAAAGCASTGSVAAAAVAAGAAAKSPPLNGIQSEKTLQNRWLENGDAVP
ncbi:hypothetical protein PMAYCL1PPCAC_26782, partial [Pristionchus mayeri]